MMKHLFKKKFTLLEILVSIIIIIMLMFVLTELVYSVILKRYEIWYVMKRVNINTVFNNNFSTLVCYSNLNEQIWINSDNIVQYWKFNVNNSTNTDEENTLCSSIRNKFKLAWDNFISDFWEKNSVESFILTRTNFKNIATYKIFYVIKIHQEDNNDKADWYIIRIWSSSIEWFLTKNDANNLYWNLVKQVSQWKLHWNDIENNQYWYKYKFVRINLVDDKQVDLSPWSAWWWESTAKDYTFNYNYFLFQVQLHNEHFSNLDYFLFKN